MAHPVDVLTEAELCQVVAQVSPAPFALFDSDLTLRWCNPSFAHMMGKSQDEVTRLHVRELFTSIGQTPHPLELLIHQAITEQTPCASAFELDLTTVTGQPLCGLAAAIPIPQAGSDDIHVLVSLVETGAQAGAAHDERLQNLERQLEERTAQLAAANEASNRLQERLLLALNASKIGTWEINAKTLGVSVYESSAKLFRLGKNSEEVPFEIYLSLVHSEDRAKVRQALLEGLGTGQEVSAVFRLYTPDGQMLWYMGRGRGVQNSDGKVVRLVGGVVDITEQKQAEEQRERLVHQLEYERKRLETIIQFIPAGVMIAEAPSGKVILVNSQLRDISQSLTLPAQDISEYARYRASHTNGRPYSAKEWPLARSILAGEIVQDEQIHVLRRDSAQGIISVSSAPIRDATGTIIAAVAIAKDITEQTETAAKLRNFNEILEQRIAQRTSSLLNYQNQLRLLSAQLADTEQRQRRQLASELHDYLAQLLVAAKLKSARIRSLTQSDLALAALGQLDDMLNECLEYTRTLIGDLSPGILYEAGLVAAIEWLGGQMKRHGLQTRVTALGDIPPLPDNDALVLFQSVHELLFNVLKHAGTDVAFVTLIQAEGILTVTVEDRGKGFAPPDFATPGEPFTSFGLLNVRERMEALCGHFEIHSAAGEGTKAILYMPLQKKPSSLLQARHAEPEAFVEPGRVLSKVIRILIADDHKIIRKGLRNLLDAYPEFHVVGEASDGEEVIEMARSLKPDAIIMDVNMPKINGIEATKRIKRENEHVIIVSLSVYQDTQIADSMLNAGAAAHLVKGEPPDQLYEILKTAGREPAGVPSG